MKLRFWPLLLLLFTQLVQAGSEVSPAGVLCNEIKTTSNPDFCKTVAARYPNGAETIENNCNYARQNFSTNREEADNLCSSTFESLIPWALKKPVNYMTTAAAHEALLAVLEEAPPRVSVAMDQCLPKPMDAYTCEIPNPLVGPNFQIVLSLPIVNPYASVPNKDPKYTEEACQCFNKASAESEKQGPRFQRQIKKEEERINELVFQSAGVRILNNFAANLEDINFYRSNKTSLLGGDTEAKNLLCNDVSQYRKKVLSACNKNNVINPEVIDKRMNDILGSLGDSKRDKTLEEKFATIEKNVLGGEIKTRVENIEGTFTRVRYDQIRFDAANALPEVSFINDVTDALLDHPVLGKELNDEMEKEHHTPGRAIFSMIKKEGRPEVKELLLKLANEPKNKGELSQEIIALLATPNETDLEKMIEQRIAKTMDMHPSLKTLFKSTELFKKVREAAHKSGTHSLLAEMEKNPAYLKNYYEERCGKMQDQFAEAVCVPNNDFIALTNREDLNHLLTPFENDINQNLKDLILCRIPPNQKPDSVFQKLAFRKWDRAGQSDYWRGKKPGANEGTFLGAVTHIVRNGDKKAIRFLGGLKQVGDNLRTPDKAYVSQNLKSDIFSPGSIGAPTATALTVPPIKDRDFALAKGLSQLSESLGAAPSEANQPPPNFVDYSADLRPVPAANTVATKDKRDKSLRSALKDFLSEEGNSAEIDKHLSQTKDEDHKELNRLKDELAKNKEMVMSLTNQTAQNKLKALQEKIQELENEGPKKTTTTGSSSEENSEQRNSPRSNNISSGNAVVSNNPGDVIRDNNVASAQTSGSESGASSAANRGPASVANARINAKGADGNMAFSSSPKGEILIEQSSAALLSGQQMAPEDLGLVIQKYVEQTELDVQTLKQLKDQEVVIKYKVVENGVEILKTMKVNSTTLTEETKRFLAAQIAMKEKEVERIEARRAHSFATLKLLLGIKTRSMN